MPNEKTERQKLPQRQKDKKNPERKKDKENCHISRKNLPKRPRKLPNSHKIMPERQRKLLERRVLAPFMVALTD